MTGITSEHFYVNYVVSNYSDWVKIADSDGFPPTEDNFVLTWEERAFWEKNKHRNKYWCKCPRWINNDIDLASAGPGND